MAIKTTILRNSKSKATAILKNNNENLPRWSEKETNEAHISLFTNSFKLSTPKFDQCGKMRCKYCESCNMKHDFETAGRRDQNRVRECRILEQKLDALDYVDSKNLELPCRIIYDSYEIDVCENKTANCGQLGHLDSNTIRLPQ